MEHPTARNSHAIDVVVNAQTAPTSVKTTDGLTRITVNIPGTANIEDICDAVSRVIPRVGLAHFRGLVVSNPDDAFYYNLRHELEELVQKCIAQDVNSGKRPERKVADKFGAPHIPVAQRRARNYGARELIRQQDRIEQELIEQEFCDAQLAKRLQAEYDEASRVREKNEMESMKLATSLYKQDLRIEDDRKLAEELNEKLKKDPNYKIPSAPVVVVSTPTYRQNVSWQHPVSKSSTMSISTTTAPTYSVIGDIIPNSRFSPARNEQYIADAINRNHNIQRGVDVSADLLRKALNKIQPNMRKATNIPPINVGNRVKLYNYVKAALGGPRADSWSVDRIVDILLSEQQ